MFAINLIFREHFSCLYCADGSFLCLQITDLLDVVLDSFIKTSATGGLGSIKAEVMADTAVALASGNVKLVSSKVMFTHIRIHFVRVNINGS